MTNNSAFLRYTRFIFIMVFIVIIAGAVVRMTQSGMGCPDWPKCFGRWVPPTNVNQLPPDYEKYLKKQDIDHSFNVYHTWVEYVNRLLGALLGVFILYYFVWSLVAYRKLNKKVVLVSLLLLLAVGFQGWLGKKVVDHNLAATKITAHMLVALLIAALPLINIRLLSDREKTNDPFLKKISFVLMLLLLLQIVLGTQVREQVDEISKSLQYKSRDLWIEKLDNFYIYHRSFSWLVAAGCFILWWRARQFSLLKNNAAIVLASAIAAIGLGLCMAFFNIPAFAQPLHLAIAATLIISVFHLRLKLK